MHVSIDINIYVLAVNRTDIAGSVACAVYDIVRLRKVEVHTGLD